ncbi:E3 ubiquitin-protein ligase BRE1-like [Lingula anatina]|uniref:E3 ubiquitin-protein ligase BRE1-like n=1 Tax=Lingula anatina TaxID=7574 RepID=A0A1S3HQY6_LINAN|nr:E3 ubiquitin-protein ligase BRE1-like [Lingula anatina]|eukprot:XP_013387951.1 E3 ubiquitin-protein ligase BRE1-like [Lingula anatina]
MPSDQTAQQSHKICEERESFLQQEISKLEQQIAEISDQHRVEYTKLQQELQTFQQHQMSDEIQRVNIEQQLKADYEKKLKGKIQQLEEQIKRAEDHNLEMARNMNFEKQQREKSDKKLQELHQAMDIKEQTLFEEVLHWIEEHNNRTRSLQEIFKENLEGANSHEKVKFETLCQLCDTLMEDLQVQRFVCSICKIKKKDCAFQPCGHYQACAACADHILTTTRVCPVCNRHLTNVMKIYE